MSSCQSEYQHWNIMKFSCYFIFRTEQSAEISQMVDSRGELKKTCNPVERPTTGEKQKEVSDSFYSRFASTSVQLKKKQHDTVNKDQFAHIDRELDSNYKQYKAIYKKWKESNVQQGDEKPFDANLWNTHIDTLVKLHKKIENRVMYCECVQYEAELLKIPDFYQISPSLHVQDVLDIHFNLKDPSILSMPLSSYQKLKLAENCAKIKQTCDTSRQGENVFEIIRLLGERRRIFQVILNF